jgi:histone-lysine N-methyltransferase SUV420H
VPCCNEILALLIFRISVGYKNKDCLCATCERLGKGGYSPNQGQEDDGVLLTKELADYESDSSIGIGSDEEVNIPVDVNERRTRRGVYHVNKDKGKRKAEVDSADSSDDEGNVDPSQ